MSAITESPLYAWMAALTFVVIDYALGSIVMGWDIASTALSGNPLGLLVMLSLLFARTLALAVGPALFIVISGRALIRWIIDKRASTFAPKPNK